MLTAQLNDTDGIQLNNTQELLKSSFPFQVYL